MDDEDRYTRITLRIPKDLHRQLSDAADKTSKSLNAEIVGRLSESFQHQLSARASPTDTPLPELVERVEQLQAKMDAASEDERRRMLKLELSVRSARESYLTSLISQTQHRIGDLEEALFDAEDADHLQKVKRLTAKIDEEKRHLASLQQDIERLRLEQKDRAEELREILKL